jgi:hypothetical protein
MPNAEWKTWWWVVLPSLLCFLPAALASAAWQEFRSNERGFVVRLPGPPIEQQERVRLPSGPVSVNLLVVERKQEETAYLVISCKLPAAVLKGRSAEQCLNDARDHAVANTPGKLIREKEIKLGAFSGRELRFQVEGKGRVRQRIFAVKDTVYQLLIAGPKPATRSPDAAKFLASFHLLRGK